MYDYFRSNGYQECELFGVTYLSAAERSTPLDNYHEPEKYRVIVEFIKSVKRCTKRDQVDLVTHSLGVIRQLHHDVDGIGHYKAKHNTGQVIHTMLATECKGIECKGPYAGGPVSAGPHPPAAAKEGQCAQ